MPGAVFIHFVVGWDMFRTQFLNIEQNIPENKSLTGCWHANVGCRHYENAPPSVETRKKTAPFTVILVSDDGIQ